jgi:hypothetical protein
MQRENEMSIADRLMANTRITPVAPQNQVKAIRKLASGDLEVTQNSGNFFTISKDDEMFQAFVVWTAINNGF